MQENEKNFDTEIMEINDDLIDVLNTTKFITVSTTNDDGSPHATPIGWFAFDGKNIIFDNHSNKIHSNNLKRDGRCFITVVNRDLGYSRAIYIDTVAKNIDGEEYEKAKKLILGKGLKVSDDIAIAPIGEPDMEKSKIYDKTDRKRLHLYMKPKKEGAV
jgi:hypothetical protein